MHQLVIKKNLLTITNSRSDRLLHNQCIGRTNIQIVGNFALIIASENGFAWCDPCMGRRKEYLCPQGTPEINMNDICRYNQTGHCKHGRQCHKRHISDICTDGKEWKDKSCVRRHPRICKYFKKKIKCMVDKCFYVHQKDQKTEKIEFLVRKIVELNADTVILKTNFHN